LKEESDDGDGGWEDFSSAVPNSSRTGENALDFQQPSTDQITDPFAEIFTPATVYLVP